MVAKDQRRIAVQMLDKLQRDMLTAVERMPAEWDEIELGWYLVHRAARTTLPTAYGARPLSMR
jgi:hypothetical protein